jgi:hypothetical protein
MSLRALSVCDAVLSIWQPRQVLIESGLFIIHFTDVTPGISLPSSSRPPESVAVLGPVNLQLPVRDAW